MAGEATAPAAATVDAIVAHHAEMEAELRRRVDDLIGVVALGEAAGGATDRVVGYAETTLLPHAASEEVTLYATASRFEARLVRSLVAEHGALRALVSRLAGEQEPAARVAAAGAIAELFATHAAKENEYVLPALLERAPGEIPGLMRRMHEEFERGSRPRVVATLDVRRIPHAARHDRIFGRLGELASGEALGIVNDHDPVPLRHQLDALWPGGFSWTYAETGPELWRVLITRRQGAERPPAGGMAPVSPVGAVGRDGHTAPAAGDAAEAPLLREVVRLLGRCLRSLGDAGRSEDAGRFAGEAWALLRESSPDEAARLSGVMHALAHAGEPEGGGPQTGSTDPGGTDGEARELDVRSDPPAVRHQRIFDTFASLGPGEAFILVNDHDPVPLRYQFAAEHAGEVAWQALEEGPLVWRVRIGRIAPAPA